MNTATSRNASPTVDAFALVVRDLTTARTGIILTHGEARVSRDVDGVYTIGKGPRDYSLNQMDSVIETTWTVDEAARSYMEHYPANVKFMVSGEVMRLRWKAESMARDIVNAAAYRAKSNRMTSALNAAMVTAKCTCKVLLADMDDQSSGYGDRVGVIVYCDSAEGANRTAKWILAWEERDYAARGGTYGGGYSQAQSSYDVRDAAAPAGVPFAVFASFRYYSRGD